MLQNYSIECAQPYDESDDSHGATALALKNLLGRISAEGSTASVVALVDDTTHPNRSFDFESYAKWLSAAGFKPDLVARESQIISSCDTILEQIDYAKLTPELRSRLQSDQKYVSQLFIAAWCLLRLGYISNDKFDPALRAERLINVLPASFQLGEEDSLDIIRATPYGDAVAKIEYVFVPEQDKPARTNKI